MADDILKMVARLKGHPGLWKRFNEQKAMALADHLYGIAIHGGFKLEWVLAAIDDAAGEVLSADMAEEPPSSRAVYQTLIRFCRRPRAPREADHQAANGQQSEKTWKERKAAETKRAKWQEDQLREYQSEPVPLAGLVGGKKR